MAKAIEQLVAAQRQTGSLLSIGLEPSFDYLPAGFERNLAGLEEFLHLVVEATSGLCCAYKANLAFFEAHGWEGWEVLQTIRQSLPEDALFIADAKRSDIGTSAAQYATALFDVLDSDAVTVNPLMGRDSVEPFAAHRDRLTFLLALTSNPGAEDFLLADGLYRRIIARAGEWNTAGNLGLVVGATRPQLAAEARALAPTMPFLVPGIGAQGGDPAQLRALVTGGTGPVVLHVTRGILPQAGDTGSVGEIIRRRATELNAAIAAAIRPGA